jgi:RNA-dependent RNA polymerase
MNYESLGRIDNSHLVKADQSPDYANDPDCLELAKYHSYAVDFPKTGYCPTVPKNLLAKVFPDYMEK